MGWFKNEYIDAVTKFMMPIIKQEMPDVQESKLKDAIEVVYTSKIKDPSINMDNNVNGNNANISLIRLISWIRRENPIVSGNGTFYCQPEVLESPTANMLRTLKKNRSQMKKQMFKYKPGSDEYVDVDLKQKNAKVIMNAEYGGSGAHTSAFYTKYSPPATTMMAQSIITVMAAFFESYIGDNQKFFNENECFDWMVAVMKKDKKVPKWIQVPTIDDVYERIIHHFFVAQPRCWPMIRQVLNTCTKDQLCYLYYANNFKDLIRNHAHMQDLLRSILTKLPIYEPASDSVPAAYASQFATENDPVLAYNRWISKQMFLNPYDVPDCIADEMKEFSDLMTQFIYVEYITPDSIVKLNNHPRNTVLLVDTDSNMIHANIFVEFVTDTIFAGETFGRERLFNDMILVNVLAATIDKSVAKLLDFYGRVHNIGDKGRAELTMKNEFMFRRFFVMNVKKRYAALTALREGNIITPMEAELKGFDFAKAGVSNEVNDRFERMLYTHILTAETPELHELMKDLKSFEKEIRNDLLHGGTTYLKQQAYKSEEGYAKVRDANGNVKGSRAWSLPVFVGSNAWNELFPENKISSLDRVSLVKMNASTINDLDVIKYKYPEMYEKIRVKIFMNPSFSKNGLKYLCIPNTVRQIPEELIPLVNIEVIVSDVISSFRSVLDALNLENVTFKTSSGNAQLTSCLISL